MEPDVDGGANGSIGDGALDLGMEGFLSPPGRQHREMCWKDRVSQIYNPDSS